MVDNRPARSWRLTLVFILFVMMISIFAYHMFKLSVGGEMEDKSNLMLMNRTPLSYHFLNEHMVYLQKVSENIENHSFSEIKSGLEKTVRILKRVDVEVQAQYDSWLKVKDKLSADGKALASLKTQLDATQKLQDSEIVRLKGMLNKAEQPSFSENLVSYVLTFFLGSLSSFFAAFISSKWKSIRNFILRRKPVGE